MFNARSETIYDKKSFSGLIRNGQTCVVALDGYYEWTKSQSLHDKKKQPYFICYRKKHKPLLLAGLWSCVKTGRKKKHADTNNTEEEETITTFTIVTTDAHPKYAWVHPRQPVILWNSSIALEWLMRPNPTIVEQLRTVPIKGSSVITGESKHTPSIWETSLSVYPVSNKMNECKYQGDDCMMEVTLAKAPPSIKSFFLSGGTKKEANRETNADGSSDVQSHAASETPSSPQRCPPFKSKEILTKEDAQGGVSRENGCEEKAWTCSTCTFIHTGSIKFEYLACEVCLTERMNGQDSGSPDVSSNNIDRGRKRKAT